MGLLVSILLLSFLISLAVSVDFPLFSVARESLIPILPNESEGIVVSSFLEPERLRHVDAFPGAFRCIHMLSSDAEGGSALKPWII